MSPDGRPSSTPSTDKNSFGRQFDAWHVKSSITVSFKQPSLLLSAINLICWQRKTGAEIIHCRLLLGGGGGGVVLGAISSTLSFKSKAPKMYLHAQGTVDTCQQHVTMQCTQWKQFMARICGLFAQSPSDYLIRQAASVQCNAAGFCIRRTL